jgi:hypothetical protein
MKVILPPSLGHAPLEDKLFIFLLVCLLTVTTSEHYWMLTVYHVEKLKPSMIYVSYLKLSEEVEMKMVCNVTGPLTPSQSNSILQQAII